MRMTIELIKNAIDTCERQIQVSVESIHALENKLEAAKREMEALQIRQDDLKESLAKLLDNGDKNVKATSKNKKTK